MDCLGRDRFSLAPSLKLRSLAQAGLGKGWVALSSGAVTCHCGSFRGVDWLSSFRGRLIAMCLEYLNSVSNIPIWGDDQIQLYLGNNNITVVHGSVDHIISWITRIGGDHLYQRPTIAIPDPATRRRILPLGCYMRCLCMYISRRLDVFKVSKVYHAPIVRGHNIVQFSFLFRKLRDASPYI